MNTGLVTDPGAERFFDAQGLGQGYLLDDGVFTQIDFPGGHGNPSRKDEYSRSDRGHFHRMLEKGFIRYLLK